MTAERIRPSYYRPRGRGNKIHHNHRSQSCNPNRQKYGAIAAWSVGEPRPRATYRGAIRNVYFNRSTEKKLINYRSYRKALLNERRSRELPQNVKDGWAIRF